MYARDAKQASNANHAAFRMVESTLKDIPSFVLISTETWSTPLCSFSHKALEVGQTVKPAVACLAVFFLAAWRNARYAVRLHTLWPE